jgi:hypothetical protein
VINLVFEAVVKPKLRLCVLPHPVERKKGGAVIVPELTFANPEGSFLNKG